MTSIVVNFQPFCATQKLYVYRDGDIIEEVDVTIEELNKTVMATQSKFSASEINLIGNQDYLSRFKAEMGTNFSNNVDINIISR